MTPEARDREIDELKEELVKLLAEGRKKQAEVCFYTLAFLMAGREDDGEGEKCTTTSTT